jgi:hypothetical protein
MHGRRRVGLAAGRGDVKDALALDPRVVGQSRKASRQIYDAESRFHQLPLAFSVAVVAT